MDVHGHELEVVISSDGKTVWVHTDNATMLRASVERIKIEDQRSTTAEEMLDNVSTEVRDLRMYAGQHAAREYEKGVDSRAGRRYADVNYHRGRQQAFEEIGAIVNRIIKDHHLDG